jgi:hypothetical protein
MNPTLVAAIVLTTAISLTPTCNAKQSAPDISTSTQGQNSATASPLITSKQVTANNHDSNPQSSGGGASSQWILIIVGTITAAFICWQAWETRRAANAAANSVAAIKTQTGVLERQAKASEDSANAANRTAEAIIKIDRAWIDIYLMQTGAAVYRMEVTNRGRTVARIKGYSLVPRFSAPAEKLPEDSRPYNFNTTQTVNASKLLEPRQEPWIAEELNLVQSLSKEDFAAVWANRRGLSYYGVMKYEDIAGEPHETEFCYYFDSSPGHRLVRVNAPEYNKHT